MSTRNYDVIIIGAGWSGIYALKHCLEEGLNAVCLERHSYPLGNWHFTRSAGGALRGTHAVSSLIYMQPSDFPFPDGTAILPHHDVIEQHMLDYIAHFDLAKHIKYRASVTEVEKQQQDWHIKTKNSTFTAPRIIVATGQTTVPKTPSDEIYTHFSGETMHSSEFNDSMLKKYAHKKVLVVGGGVESCDIAQLFSDRSDVTLSIRSGQWFQPLALGAYEPADALYTRFVHGFLPLYLIAKYAIAWIFQQVFGKGGSGIKGWEPNAHYFNGFYNKNRDVIRSIAKGRITAQRAVKSISGTQVEFEDGSLLDVDLLVFGTGYNPAAGHDFLPQKYTLYKKIIATEDPSVAFVGFARPYLGSIVFLSEIQSRVIAKFFAGQLQLPSRQEMKTITRNDRKRQLEEFPRDAQSNSSIVNLYDYTDELADMIGAKPRLSLILTNPRLWWMIMRQIHTPFSLRVYDADAQKRAVAIHQIEKFNKRPIVTKVNLLVKVVLAIEIFVVVSIISMIGWIFF